MKRAGVGCGFAAVAFAFVALLATFLLIVKPPLLALRFVASTRRSARRTAVTHRPGYHGREETSTHICGLPETEIEVLAHDGDRYSASDIIQGFSLVALGGSERERGHGRRGFEESVD